MNKHNPVKRNEQYEKQRAFLFKESSDELLDLRLDIQTTSDKTAETYLTICRSLFPENRLFSDQEIEAVIEKVSSQNSRNYYGKIVAALKHCSVRMVSEAQIVRADQNMAPTQKEKLIKSLLYKAALFAFVVEEHKKPAEFDKVVSKRQENRTLAKDWYTQFTARVAAQTSKYRPHLLIATLAGTRPVEFTIENGVQVFFDNHTIKIRTVGAKQKVAPDSTQLAGQPWRYIVFDLNDPKIAADPAIIELLKYKPELGTVYQPPLLHQKGEGGLRGYDAACNRAGEGLLKHGRTKANKGLFSGYNLRQAFASRMKASGLSQADISRSLGHVSEKTKQYYGFAASRNAGGVSPTVVASAIAPRVSKGVMHSSKAKAAKTKARTAPRFRP